MREATGELNITVITIVAIVAISGLFIALILPVVKQNVLTHTCKASYGANFKAIKEGNTWKCQCDGALPVPPGGVNCSNAGGPYAIGEDV